MFPCSCRSGAFRVDLHWHKPPDTVSGLCDAESLLGVEQNVRRRSPLVGGGIAKGLAEKEEERAYSLLKPPQVRSPIEISPEKDKVD
jgi:hypothetical protein